MKMGHNEKLYPLERIMAAANWATHKGVDALPDVKKYIDDDDSAVRYWAAVGILNRGASAVAVSDKELKNADDRCIPVRTDSCVLCGSEVFEGFRPC